MRSWIGSVRSGSVWKNFTPPTKSLIVRPVSGSSMMPVGRLTLMNTLSGPSSESASWIEKPPIPAIEKPPCRPAKKTRFATGVVVSVSAMMFPFASSLRMPPISAASRSPPKSLPLTWTPSEAMPTIGNSPWRELADVDLDPLDRAGELEAADPLDPGDARREREDEVPRIGVDVRPLDADRVDVDREPARPLEAVAGRGADGELDAEVVAGREAAVAEEAEVRSATGDRDATDRQRCTRRAEADEALRAGRRGVRPGSSTRSASGPSRA